MLTDCSLTLPAPANNMANNHPPMGLGAPPAPANFSMSAALPKDATTSTTPFRFMDLPVELRLQVYRQFVVVGKVFFTPDSYDCRNNIRFKDCEKYPKPSLAILRVSKALHAEAKDVYIAENLFVLPFNFERHGPSNHSSNRNHRTLFSAGAVSKLRHVSVEVSSRDADKSPCAHHPVWKREEKKKT